MAARALAAAADSMRIATFNASMNRAAPGLLRADVESGTSTQSRAIAERIQRVNPDALLITECDYDPLANLPAPFKGA